MAFPDVCAMDSHSVRKCRTVLGNVVGGGGVLPSGAALLKSGLFPRRVLSTKDEITTGTCASVCGVAACLL